MSKKYFRYKVNASDIPHLMAHEQGNNPVTEKDFSDFLRITQKDMVDITALQKKLILEVISKTVNYDAGSVSTSFKKALYEDYAYSQFGAGKVALTGDKPIQFDKGEVAEPDAIQLLSKIDGIEYKKNDTLHYNKFFKGIPDIVIMEGDKIVGVKDVKVPLDLPNFLERVDGDYLKDDAWEMRAYLDILGLKEGEICYCLVDLPASYRKRRLGEHKLRMELLGYEPGRIKRRLKQIERSMIYDYIPEHLKVKRFTIERKSWFTKQMHERVKLIRSKLQLLHEKFENPLILGKTAPLQESID